VTGAYGGACAVSREHSLPVLEAAHIQPYGSEGAHDVANGLLLRADIHRLFDGGYVTVTPDHRFVVSQRLAQDGRTGRRITRWTAARSRCPRVSRTTRIPSSFAGTTRTSSSERRHSVDVSTVTTSDRSLLHAVRGVLSDADEAFLCVAFVQEKGVHLVERELDGLRERGVRPRLLVTTTFATTSDPALGTARRLGAHVRVLNPGSGSTFHPKLYLGKSRSRARAVIGSANLTGGLATNLDAAVALEGTPEDVPIAAAWRWVEALWEDPRVVRWDPAAVRDAPGETLSPELLDAITREWKRDPVFAGHTSSEGRGRGRHGGRRVRRDGPLARAPSRRGGDPRVDVQSRVAAHQEPRESGRLADGLRIGRKLAGVAVHG
jgi:HKD family nuclease